MKTLRIRHAVGYGFNAFLSHIGFLAFSGLLVGGLYTVMSFALGCLLYVTGLTNSFLPGSTNAVICLLNYMLVGDKPVHPGMILAVIGATIIVMMVSIWSTFVFTNISLQIRDTGTASFKDLYSFIPQLPELFVVTLIVGLVTIFGLIALIVPGIYWMGRSLFISFVVLDKRMYSWPSMKKSWAITRGHGWHLVGLLFTVITILAISATVSIVLLYFGTLVIGHNLYCLMLLLLASVGVIWAGVMISTLINADAYRQLNPKS